MNKHHTSTWHQTWKFGQDAHISVIMSIGVILACEMLILQIVQKVHAMPEPTDNIMTMNLQSSDMPVLKADC